MLMVRVVYLLLRETGKKVDQKVLAMVDDAVGDIANWMFIS